MRRLLLLPALAAALLAGGCINSLGEGTAYPGQATAYPAQRTAYPAPSTGYASFPGPAYGDYDPRRDQGLSDWYRDHSVERQAELMQCGQNPGVAQDPRCLAAIQADRQEASFQRAQAQFGNTGYGAPVMLGPIVTPQIK